MGASTVTPDTENVAAGHPRLWRRPEAMVLLALGSTLAGLLGCGSDTTGPAPLAPGAAYWTLQFNHRAVNLALTAPYDTVLLHAAALTATGTPLAGAGAVTYTTSDSALHVDSTGLVRARYTTNGATAHVIATLTAQGVTLTDTALFQVTDTVPHYPLATFSIQVNPNDVDALQRTVVPVDWSGNDNTGSFLIPVYITDTHGDSLCTVANTFGSPCPLLVSWTTSDPTMATFDALGDLQPHNLGQVTIYASVLAYGVARQDSLRLTIGYPTNPIVNAIVAVWATPPGSVTPMLTFSPSTETIGVGGGVVFFNSDSTDSMDVVFDDSTAVSGLYGDPGGNIPPMTTNTPDPSGASGAAFRKFPIAGIYTYHSRKYGSGGKIIVR